jgi:hypothetical protein
MTDKKLIDTLGLIILLCFLILAFSFVNTDCDPSGSMLTKVFKYVIKFGLLIPIIFNIILVTLNLINVFNNSNKKDDTEIVQGNVETCSQGHKKDHGICECDLNPDFNRVNHKEELNPIYYFERPDDPMVYNNLEQTKKMMRKDDLDDQLLYRKLNHDTNRDDHSDLTLRTSVCDTMRHSFNDMLDRHESLEWWNN